MIELVTNLSDIRERYGAGSKEYKDELLLMKKNKQEEVMIMELSNMNLIIVVFNLTILRKEEVCQRIKI